MFAALNTVEPPILELVTARFEEGDKPWAEERLPLVKDRIRDRLVQLSVRLGDADWLDGAFQRGRSDDGVGAAQAESFGPSRRVSETGCLCCPRRSAARIQTGFRRPMGDQRRSSASWLTQSVARPPAPLEVTGGGHGCQSSVMTTLPLARPCSTYASASRVWSNGNVVSMTGRRWPAS